MHITSTTKEQNRLGVLSGDIWHRLNGIFNPRHENTEERSHTDDWGLTSSASPFHRAYLTYVKYQTLRADVF